MKYSSQIKRTDVCRQLSLNVHRLFQVEILKCVSVFAGKKISNNKIFILIHTLTISFVLVEDS